MKYLKTCLNKILKIKKEGFVIDLGCGEGKLTKFFLSKGFNVTAIDNSEENVDKLKKNLKRFGNKVKIVKTNLEEFSFDKDYDVIIAKNVLHFLSNEKAKELIEEIKNHTKKDGINLIIGLTIKDRFYNKKRFFIKEREMKKMYKGWNFLFFKSFFMLDKHDGLPPHKHHIFIGLFQKAKAQLKA